MLAFFNMYVGVLGKKKKSLPIEIVHYSVKCIKFNADFSRIAGCSGLQKKIRLILTVQIVFCDIVGNCFFGGIL